MSKLRRSRARPGAPTPLSTRMRRPPTRPSRSMSDPVEEEAPHQAAAQESETPLLDAAAMSAPTSAPTRVPDPARTGLRPGPGEEAEEESTPQAPQLQQAEAIPAAVEQEAPKAEATQATAEAALSGLEGSMPGLSGGGAGLSAMATTSVGTPSLSTGTGGLGALSSLMDGAWDDAATSQRSHAIGELADSLASQQKFVDAAAEARESAAAELAQAASDVASAADASRAAQTLGAVLGVLAGLMVLGGLTFIFGGALLSSLAGIASGWVGAIIGIFSALGPVLTAALPVIMMVALAGSLVVVATLYGLAVRKLREAEAAEDAEEQDEALDEAAADLEAAQDAAAFAQAQAGAARGGAEDVEGQAQGASPLAHMVQGTLSVLPGTGGAGDAAVGAAEGSAHAAGLGADGASVIEEGAAYQQGQVGGAAAAIDELKK